MARRAAGLQLPVGDPWRLQEPGGQRSGGAEEAGWGLGHGLPCLSLAGAPEPLGPPRCISLPVDQGGRKGWSDELATPGQDQDQDAGRAVVRFRRAPVAVAVGRRVGQQGSVAVCPWQAIRRARRVGASFPTAGEEWREGGDRAPSWAANQVSQKFSSPP